MTNIKIEMNFYTCAREYVVMVLFDDAEGISSSINWFFKSRSKAAKQMAVLENQYSVKGSINE